MAELALSAEVGVDTAEVPCRLTTFAWTGVGVETKAGLTRVGDRLYVRLPVSSAALARIWNLPRVRVVPCAANGRPAGPALEASARLVEASDDDDVLEVEIVPRAQPA